MKDEGDQSEAPDSIRGMKDEKMFVKELGIKNNVGRVSASLSRSKPAAEGDRDPYAKC